MSQVPSNRRHPCFCDCGCPPGFVPYQKYRVKAPDGVFPGYFDWKLLIFSSEAMDGVCAWLPAEPLPNSPPVAFRQDLKKNCLAERSYDWLFVLEELPNVNAYRLVVTWLETDVIVSHMSPACDALQLSLVEVTTLDVASLEAVPEWMCTDAQARAWPAS